MFLKLLRERLTYANVVSSLCLFLVLSGGAYASVAATGSRAKARTAAKYLLTPMVQACVKNKGGAVRLPYRPVKCRGKEHQVAWPKAYPYVPATPVIYQSQPAVAGGGGSLASGVHVVTDIAHLPRGTYFVTSTIQLQDYGEDAAYFCGIQAADAHNAAAAHYITNSTAQTQSGGGNVALTNLATQGAVTFLKDNSILQLSCSAGSPNFKGFDPAPGAHQSSPSILAIRTSAPNTGVHVQSEAIPLSG